MSQAPDTLPLSDDLLAFTRPGTLSVAMLTRGNGWIL
jgi:hypothetical protein